MAKRAKKSKTAKSARRRNPLPQRRTRRPGQLRVAGMDAGAALHRNLLLDPCNATLGPPVYAGLGTGQYRRYRTYIVAEGSSVEGCYVFQLGTNSFWKASHVSGTAGSAYTFNAGDALFTSNVSATLQLRCIAGCVKVRYVGAESSRAGVIGLLAAPSQMMGPSQTSSAGADLTRCPVVHRVGEVQHEVKFVPNCSDELFVTPSIQGVQLGITNGNSSLMVVYRGTPAQTIQFEVTAVYEMEEAGSSGNTVITSVMPSSSVTLNQLLRGLGPVANWAYSNMVAPTIRSLAGKANSTFISNVAAVSRAVAAIAI